MPRGVQATTGGPLVTDAALSLEVPPGPAGPVVDVRGARGHFGRWLARRLALGVVILFAVSIIVFLATQALPSNPSQAILGRNATPASVAALNHKLGLDNPLITQYTDWLGRLLRGHFGVSLATGEPVGSLISHRVANSLTLLVFAALIALPLSFFLGTITAVRRGPFDRGTLLIGVVLSAMPDFVIAITLVILFATVVFTIFPGVALVPPGTSPLDHPNELVLPVMTLVLLNVPYLYRLVRASMIDVLGSEYVAMARLKGMPPRIVIVRHSLRNALLPAIAGAGIVLGWLLGSVVVVENVFQYPGLGSALTDAVHNRDLPVIQAVVLVFAVGIVLFNLIADALTIYLTPKLRTGSDL
jgi:peptide/nickel transport system permease protein